MKEFYVVLVYFYCFVVDFVGFVYYFGVGYVGVCGDCGSGVFGGCVGMDLV